MQVTTDTILTSLVQQDTSIGFTYLWKNTPMIIIHK